MSMTRNLNVKVSDDLAKMFDEIKAGMRSGTTNDDVIAACIKTTHRFLVEGEKP